MPKSAAPVVEDLPVSDRAQEIIHQVAIARRRSELARFGSRLLTRETWEGSLPLVDLDIVEEEVAAREQMLTAPAGQEPPVMTEPTVVVDKPWSPTDILDTMPRYELDAKQRAAGDHLDLDRD